MENGKIKRLELTRRTYFQFSLTEEVTAVTETF